MDESADNKQLVIVALPSEDDYVRKLSSEKEPHLTLLYLGENTFDQTQLAHVSDYLEYASSLLLRFVLDVGSRGELGDNKADVLFFDKRWTENIAIFRNQLLQDDLIAGAYASADQFPGWTPHLTMGFPATPAKKDTRDYPGISYVNFDRVALWTGDSIGPTFPLKSNYHDDLEVAMSQAERGQVALGGVLEHHGVKGMKWGQNKAASSGGAAPRPRMSEDVRNVAKATKKLDIHGTTALSNTELQSVISRMNLENQYHNLTKEVHQNELDKGLQGAQKILKVGKTIEDARKFLETPTGKAVKKGLKTAFTAAKVAAAFNSGGTSAAAGTGAQIAVRQFRNHFTNVGN